MSHARLARAWIILGSSALLMSGILAMAITGAKIPGLAERMRDLDVIRWCLVAHVNLATLVWFTAIPMGLSHLAAGMEMRASKFHEAAFVTATTGVLLMILTLPGRGVTPVLANYIPVIFHPQYLVGLGLYFAGLILTWTLRPLNLPGPSRPVQRFAGLSEVGFGLWLGGFYLLLAVLAIVLSVVALQGVMKPGTKSYFEIAMWGGGHLLQHASTTFLAAFWVVLLSGIRGSSVLSRRELFPVFAWLGIPALIAPVLFYLEPTSTTYRDGFTHLMRWGIFPPLLLLVAKLLLRVGPELRAIRRDDRMIAVAGSFLLLALGCVFGALIRGADLRVPGHYHATIGAVTLAFLSAAFHALSAESVELRRRWIRRSVAFYAIGQTLFASGMFMAGASGLSRKTYGSEHTIGNLGQALGLGGMAIGGLLAFTGGLLFARAILPAFRSREAWEGSVPDARRVHGAS